MLLERVGTCRIALPPEPLEVLVDMVARLVLGHVMQPSATPGQTADDLAWLAGRLLDR